MYTGQQTVSSFGMKGKIPPISLSLVLWPRSIFSRAPAQSLTLWQPVQFTLTVDRTAGCELDTRWCVFLCVFMHAYMKPQQSLLLYRRWVAGESAAYKAKHFLHGERQGAQLNIKHLAVGWRQKRIICSCKCSYADRQEQTFISRYFYKTILVTPNVLSW